MANEDSKIQKVVNLCLRRGFVFPSAELYGSFGGCFDYGPAGVELKRNIVSAWWRHFVHNREDMLGLDGAVVTHPRIWKASGHLDEFNDPLVECKKCKSRFRADHLIEQELNLSVDGVSEQAVNDLMKKHKLACPKCKGELSESKNFNLMFKTFIGSNEDAASTAYLRPETAQVIFTQFKTMQQIGRKSLPFGIAQVGKAFRNEISPRNFVFRAREFEQMEIEFFIHPEKLNDCPDFEAVAKRKALFCTAAHQEEKNKSHDNEADRSGEENEKLKDKADQQSETSQRSAKNDAKKQRLEKSTNRQESQKSSDGDLLTFGQAIERKIIQTKWQAYWLAQSLSFFESLGLRNLRLRQHTKTELSHYAAETWDVEYKYPEWGWKELQGVANRTDFDLKAHSKESGKDLSIFDEATKQKVVPFVIEPSFGLDRLAFTLLLDAYGEKNEQNQDSETRKEITAKDEKTQKPKNGQENEETKIVLKLSPTVAPVPLAVFPLMKKDGLAEKARQIYQAMKKSVPSSVYDESGSIGKRYARQDEIGTPFCITIDHQTLQDETVTLRERDSGEQKRIKSEKISQLPGS